MIKDNAWKHLVWSKHKPQNTGACIYALLHSQHFKEGLATFWVGGKMCRNSSASSWHEYDKLLMYCYACPAIHILFNAQQRTHESH